MLSKDEFQSKITEIGSCEDMVKVRTMLTELSDNVSEIYDQNENLTGTNTQLQTDNEALRSANMQLFLKVGGQKKAEDLIPDDKKPDRIEESFEELYNKKRS